MWKTFQDTLPSIMEMSTNWPRPVCSRAMSAARMPTVAIKRAAADVGDLHRA